MTGSLANLSDARLDDENVLFRLSERSRPDQQEFGKVVDLFVAITLIKLRTAVAIARGARWDDVSVQSLCDDAALFIADLNGDDPRDLARRLRRAVEQVAGQEPAAAAARLPRRVNGSKRRSLTG